MAENDIEQKDVKVTEQVTEDTAVQAAPAIEEPALASKKRVRIGLIFLSVVPVAILLFIQTITQIPFFIMAAADIAKDNPSIEAAEDVINTSENLMRVFVDNYALYAYTLYAVIGIIVFGIWYFAGFVRKNPKVRLSQVFGVKSVVAAIGMVLGLNFAISAAFTLAVQLLPDVMDSYMELMQSAGIGNNLLITVIYVIFLGPVLEELCLRGVTYGFLERSGIKPIFVILISGVLFGAMHLNLVQGIYAAVLGFFLGFLRYKYRSILLTIFTHILFNTMGTYGDAALEKMGISDGMTLILGGLSLIVLVFVVVLINGDKKALRISE